MTFHHHSNKNRPERPQTQRKAVSGSAYGNSTPLPSHWGSSRSVGTSSTSNSSWQHVVSEQRSGQQDALDHFNYYDLRSPTPTNSRSQSTIIQDGDQLGISAAQSTLTSSDSISCNLALSQSINSNEVFMSHQSPDSSSWDAWTPNSSSYMGSQPDEIPLSENQQSGIYGSINNIASSSPDTMASVPSDNVGFPGASPTWDSPLSNEGILKDQNIPAGYFEMIPPGPQNFMINAPQNSKAVPSNDIFVEESTDWNILSTCTTTENATWPPNDSASFSEIPAHDPWNTEDARRSKHGPKENAGNGAFGPDAGFPYVVLKRREELFHAAEPRLPHFGPQRSFLAGNDHDQRQNPFQQYIAPSACNYESPEEPPESHEHVFSAITGMGIPENSRGRKRKLTPEEKQRTLEVRKDGACWACHLSKTKCSPCSSGSPCEQCTRLVGKRRFCFLPCFNDPIESLYTFLVPDFLVGHFTKANVEAFIGKHASQWGTQTISVRMSWGCRRLLPVNVVALQMLGEASELGYNHQAITDGTGSEKLVRSKCAPLGIPLADMGDMKEEYRRHVEDVVKSDLSHYVSIAYDDESSKLAECLLEAVCQWYQRGVRVGDESVLLREAIEIHVTSTILGRSLVLDQASIEDVQAHLGQQYPCLSAPRGAQRQMKLAFYMEQTPRIMRVLGQWGKLMRSTAGSDKKWDDKKWATAFCVFIMLTLIMDKTIISACYFCEGRIKFRGRDAKTERAKFENLKRLMETELFEKCKEIFHCRYKTRKGGSERCNPIRDGVAAWRGEAVDRRTLDLVDEMRRVVRDFGRDIVPQDFRDPRFAQVGNVVNGKFARLASIFLRDFNFS